MKKVITYGTYDLLHHGHIKLLQRAKALGDYLIVGVTADTFDRSRGKINVQQSLIERINNVRDTGLADEIVVEEYIGQKIDDIRRLNVDVFTVGSDWKGKFDYLKEFCEVVYLDRTEGISSSELRCEQRDIRIGLVGDSAILNKFENESHYVNGVTISGVCTNNGSLLAERLHQLPCVTDQLDELLNVSDAIYVISKPEMHYEHIYRALGKGKHVLCETPITIKVEQWCELQQMAKDKGLVLADGLKTAYSMAYDRLCLLAKSGAIGKVVSVDATCTSLQDMERMREGNGPCPWNSICAWGPTALLPIFQLLGTDYISKQIVTHLLDEELFFDAFTKVSFVYPHAVASLKVGQGVKSEGELVVSGTKGYIYVPAPWWKTDYFEVRYENPAENKRYFYQLDGEGIRYEILSFIKSIKSSRNGSYIDVNTSEAIIRVIQDFYEGRDVIKM
ncbi:putative glycerol-3-phosphate cytidylyltransferase [Prevotella sp. DNF00663]|uniref:Gfo/Idh/MocA family oxidoreductase n=1 Tax=Prevotella sp. DNF00663 TaxID=1384078 RepID=UPI00078616C6|nr:Gfo/Idh/MocA family oxidoreductase [Prevotella sp. DNF00663]KXB84079.1 putative glycerol-3-phosphate cytidylyltransferase [Prevotella sp. DNF00663]